MRWVANGILRNKSLPDVEKWVGLKSIGMVERVCLIGEKETVEHRYFINSFAADASIFAKAVREHFNAFALYC